MKTEILHDSESPAQSPLFLRRDGEWWDAGMLIALAIAGLVAIVVAMFTFGAVKAHKREAAIADKQLAEYKAATDRRMTDAREEIAKAEARAAEANARAAEAHSQAIETNLELEKTRLKLNEIQSVKLFPSDYISKLESELSKINPKYDKFFAIYESNNEEAQHRAYQLDEALKSAGFENGLGDGVGDEARDKNDSGEIIIINADASTNDLSEKVFRAFKKSGFSVSRRFSPPKSSDQFSELSKSYVLALVLKRDHGGF